MIKSVLHHSSIWPVSWFWFWGEFLASRENPHLWLIQAFILIVTIALAYQYTCNKCYMTIKYNSGVRAGPTVIMGWPEVGVVFPTQILMIHAWITNITSYTMQHNTIILLWNEVSTIYKKAHSTNSNCGEVTCQNGCQNNSISTAM